MNRTTSAADRRHLEPAPERKQRMRKCSVASCRTPFAPRNMMHKCCSAPCAADFAIAERVRKERSERQEGLRKLKRRADHIADAQVAFNAYIRARDAARPCICCGRTSITESRGGTWDAGHYRSRGSAPHLRFDERNVHAQLKNCNRYGAGRAVDYRIGLIARIGQAAVEALEADQAPVKWTVDELLAIKATYREKLKQLKEAT